MDYENMRVAELKAFTKERGLRGYSRLRKAELIALLRPAPPTRPAVPGDPLRGGPHERRPPRPSRDLLHLRLALDQIDRGNQNCCDNWMKGSLVHKK